MPGTGRRGFVANEAENMASADVRLYLTGSPRPSPRRRDPRQVRRRPWRGSEADARGDGVARRIQAWTPRDDGAPVGHDGEDASPVSACN